MGDTLREKFKHKNKAEVNKRHFISSQGLAVFPFHLIHFIEKDNTH